MLKKIYFIGSRGVKKSSIIDFLIENQYQVIDVALDSGDVISRIFSDKPDLILLNLETDRERLAQQVLEKVKAIYDIPLIIYSDNLNEINCDKLLGVGIDGFVSAQTPSEDLLINLKIALQRFNSNKTKSDSEFESQVTSIGEFERSENQISGENFNNNFEIEKESPELQNVSELLSLGEEFIEKGYHIKNKIKHQFAQKQIELEELNNNLNRLVEERTKKLQIEVDERRRAQEMQQRFSNVIEQSSDLVMIANTRGVIEYVNPALCEFTEFKKDEIIGRKPSIFKSNMYDDSYYKRLWSTIMQGRTFSDEFVNKKKNGDLYTVSQIIIPLKNLDGEITHFASVCRDSTEKKKLEKRIIDIQEEERSRISREMHDGIGQSVAAIRLSINRIFSKYEIPEKELSEMSELINSLTNSVREISYDLMPSILIDYGLVTAASKMINHIKKNTNTKIYFTFSNDDKRPPKDMELSLFRILQEAISNAIKYSNASKIIVSLECINHTIYLKIKDNGCGFDSTDDKEIDGQGIRNMKHRTHLMNGVFALYSSEEGTEIKVKVPFKNCTT